VVSVAKKVIREMRTADGSTVISLAEFERRASEVAEALPTWWADPSTGRRRWPLEQGSDEHIPAADEWATGGGGVGHVTHLGHAACRRDNSRNDDDKDPVSETGTCKRATTPFLPFEKGRCAFRD
jgi:hypothetical protein